jgi:DNA helicase-2/ATP-dependent DNA helicase PcrA
VFIAGLERGLVPIGHAATPAAEAEERRLLYVAITRARETLRCTWAERRSFGAKAIPRSPSAYLESIEMTIGLLQQGVAPTDLRAKIAAERERLASLTSARRARVAATSKVAGANADADVLSALKAWRSETARAAGMPAYVIFHDTTLAALAEALPRSERELLTVPGVGPVKVDRYGADVLRVLAQVAARDEAS